MIYFIYINRNFGIFLTHQLDIQQEYIIDSGLIQIELTKAALATVVIGLQRWNNVTREVKLSLNYGNEIWMYNKKHKGKITYIVA